VNSGKIGQRSKTGVRIITRWRALVIATRSSLRLRRQGGASRHYEAIQVGRGAHDQRSFLSSVGDWIENAHYSGPRDSDSLEWHEHMMMKRALTAHIR